MVSARYLIAITSTLLVARDAVAVPTDASDSYNIEARDTSYDLDTRATDYDMEGRDLLFDSRIDIRDEDEENEIPSVDARSPLPDLGTPIASSIQVRDDSNSTFNFSFSKLPGYDKCKDQCQTKSGNFCSSANDDVFESCLNCLAQKSHQKASQLQKIMDRYTTNCKNIGVQLATKKISSAVAMAAPLTMAGVALGMLVYLV